MGTMRQVINNIFDKRIGICYKDVVRRTSINMETSATENARTCVAATHRRSSAPRIATALDAQNSQRDDNAEL